MKLLIGMMAFLAVGVTLSRMAVTRLGMSESDARLILYITAAVWVLGMTIALVRWILARRAAAASASAVMRAWLSCRVAINTVFTCSSRNSSR